MLRGLTVLISITDKRRTDKFDGLIHDFLKKELLLL